LAHEGLNRTPLLDLNVAHRHISLSVFSGLLDLFSILKPIGGAGSIQQTALVADRKRKPRRLRVAFVGAPPLLIDVIQTVLSSRFGIAVVAKINEIETVPGALPNIAPDVVIVGPAADSGQLNALLRTLLPSARVLTVSADLLQLLGPGDDDVTDLTLENLMQRLQS
jgi:hypothetical protein